MLPEIAIVKITFQNGSLFKRPFYSYSDAQNYCRRNVSYSGGKISRVEILDVFANSTRAVWDATWDDQSKAAGLAPSL